MKSTLLIVLISAIAGIGVGASTAYFEVPATTSVEPTTVSNQPPTKTKKPSKLKSVPHAVLPEKVFEFGKIERGASMSHAFKIRNEGELPLTVKVASTTCKCTVGDLAKDVLGPNEETEVLLEWVAKTPPGPFRHGAVLSTNDPTQSSINLTVEGKVVESTAMAPAELMFGTIQAGDTRTASLYLMTFLDQEIEVRDYELSDPELAKQMEVSITPAETAELPSPEAVRGLKVAVKYQSGESVGPFHSWLTLDTNLPNAEKLTVPIHGRVVGDVSIFGPGWNAQQGWLTMGTFSGAEGKAVTLKVAVRGEHAQDAQLEVAEVDPPELKATLGEPKKMGDNLVHVPLKVELPPGTKPIVRLGEPVSSDAQIVLRSAHAEVPDVRLRVRFAVK